MSSTVLAKTAQGASSLILLQVASRALTFAVNQFLLRFLNPQILGVATQLELFSISTLYFSRESIRVTIQRQGGDGESDKSNTSEEKPGTRGETNNKSRRIQEAVNLSWLAIALGTFLTFLFEWLYVRRASAAVLQTKYMRASVRLYSVATICELLIEPSFAIAQQQMLYGMRASSEIQATFLRCIVTCSTAFWASRQNRDIGTIPFALGQLTYATILNLNYRWRLSPACSLYGVNTTPRRTSPDSTLIPHHLLFTAGNLYGQSLFKQLLTSGDQYLVAAMASLSSQGSYALASNYGGLLARILFQPIEESSRSLFARLLPAKKSRTDGACTEQAVTYLTGVLHAYLTLSVLAVSLGPPLARPLLHLLLGAAWSTTEAPKVLASYCYYIPMLAINGLLEAFVAAVATPMQLRQQSLWMIAFSVLFATSGTIVLGWLAMGAQGLVIANIVTMMGRIAWSWNFVTQEIKSRRGSLVVFQSLPSVLTIAVGVGARSVLEEPSMSDGSFGQLLKAGLVVAVCGLAMCVPVFSGELDMLTSGQSSLRAAILV